MEQSKVRNSVLRQNDLMNAVIPDPDWQNAVCTQVGAQVTQLQTFTSVKPHRLAYTVKLYDLFQTH
jgi:hypothetical protein